MFFEKIELNHEALVANALDAFTQAENKMSAAIATIQTDIDKKESEVAKIQGQILGAEESKSKLSRVLERVRALTA